MYIVMKTDGKESSTRGTYDTCESVDEALGMVNLYGGRILEVRDGSWYSVKTSAHLVYDKSVGTSWSKKK